MARKALKTTKEKLYLLVPIKVEYETKAARKDLLAVINHRGKPRPSGRGRIAGPMQLLDATVLDNSC